MAAALMRAQQSLPRSAWARELGGRARRSLVLTIAGTTLLTGVFFVGYFYVQRFPLRASTLMPVTSLDVMLPFQPWAVFAYLSLWIYIGAGPGLQSSRRDMGVYALWVCALCLTGLSIFYLWPTRTPEWQPPPTRLPLLGLLHRVDRAGNACPSLHVAVAMFTLVRVAQILRAHTAPWWLRAMNVCWCLLIIYSTLAIKQHVVWDVLAGMLLGLTFAFLSRTGQLSR